MLATKEKQTEYYIYLNDKELVVIEKHKIEEGLNYHHFFYSPNKMRQYNQKPINHSSLKSILMQYTHLSWNLQHVTEAI